MLKISRSQADAAAENTRLQMEAAERQAAEAGRSMHPAIAHELHRALWAANAGAPVVQVVADQDLK